MKDTVWGTVYWLTGLPGAGKSSLGRTLQMRLQQTHSCILLDGDQLREVWNNYAYDPESRREIAFGYSRLCRLLASQGIDVICATVSLFHEVQAWNRANLHYYCEILIDVPLTDLQQRNQKGLYSAAQSGEQQELPGWNWEPEWPLAPDIVINNDDQLGLAERAEQLWQAIQSR